MLRTATFDQVRITLDGARRSFSSRSLLGCCFRLPPYLTVQMVRFFYKAATQQKAKILRKVRPPAEHLPMIALSTAVTLSQPALCSCSSPCSLASTTSQTGQIAGDLSVPEDGHECKSVFGGLDSMVGLRFIMPQRWNQPGKLSSTTLPCILLSENEHLGATSRRSPSRWCWTATSSARPNTSPCWTARAARRHRLKSTVPESASARNRNRQSRRAADETCLDVMRTAEVTASC